MDRSLPKLGVTVEQAVQMTGIGRTTLFNEIKEGRLVRRKVGRKSLILISDLEAWLNALPSHSTPPTGPVQNRKPPSISARRAKAEYDEEWRQRYAFAAKSANGNA